MVCIPVLNGALWEKNSSNEFQVIQETEERGGFKALFDGRLTWEFASIPNDYH